MTQATDRSNPSNSKGFGNSPKATTPTQAGSGDDRAYRAQVAAEIAQLRSQVNQAVQGQTAGINAIATEYEQSIQPLVDEASQLIYDMLSGRTAFTQIGQNVGALMSQHPMGEKASLGEPMLKRLSLKPLQPATQPSYLSGAADATER
ncbi:hypothetical protein H6F75_00645 [Nodosilinea sp. FACHB-131]|uniref:hypothetical protein n=1 Tax=Cyanophyceae TaxID=3028117 RepID=UPI0016856F33|nr:hypothetical protein [Nodosilinea sp. FACHB-131]MBD1871979.1 hypothetical protein [Nodosilinea sp. FACHB-131]